MSDMTPSPSLITQTDEETCSRCGGPLHLPWRGFAESLGMGSYLGYGTIGNGEDSQHSQNWQCVAYLLSTALTGELEDLGRSNAEIARKDRELGRVWAQHDLALSELAVVTRHYDEIRTDRPLTGDEMRTIIQVEAEQRKKANYLEAAMKHYASHVWNDIERELKDLMT